MNRLEYESANPFEVSIECRMPFRRRVAESARQLIGPVPICATFAVCLWWAVNRGILILMPRGLWVTSARLQGFLSLQYFACVALAVATAAFVLLVRHMNNLRYRPLRLGMIFGAILMAAMLFACQFFVHPGDPTGLWEWKSVAFVLFCLPLFAGIQIAKRPAEHPSDASAGWT